MGGLRGSSEGPLLTGASFRLEQGPSPALGDGSRAARTGAPAGKSVRVSPRGAGGGVPAAEAERATVSSHERAAGGGAGGGRNGAWRPNRAGARGDARVLGGCLGPTVQTTPQCPAPGLLSALPPTLSLLPKLPLPCSREHSPNISARLWTDPRGRSRCRDRGRGLHNPVLPGTLTSGT